MATRIPVDLPARATHDDTDLPGRVLEASQTGVLFWSEQPLTPEQPVELMIDFGASGPVNARAKVVHSRISDYPYPEEGYLSGIRFTVLTSDEEAILTDYLRRHRYSRYRRPKFR